MQVGQFPAAAANSLIQGYCDDFVSLAAVLAQTLEQVSMRGINFNQSRASLERIESGMRNLSSAIHELLQGQQGGQATSPTTSQPATPPSQQTPGTAAKPVVRAPEPVASTRAPAPTPTPASCTPPAPSPFAPITPATPAAHQAPTSPGHAATAPAARSRPETAETRLLRSARSSSTPASRELARPAVPPTASRNNQLRPAPQKADALRGTNQSMPVRSVFQFLGRMRKSGTITIEFDSEIITFEFQSGCVVHSTSDRSPENERLGELLIELGFCKRSTMVDLLQDAEDSGSRLGQLIVERRIASNGQVLEALELQVRRRFARATECGEASYEFVEGARQEEDGRIRITPMELTFEPKR